MDHGIDGVRLRTVGGRVAQGWVRTVGGRVAHETCVDGYAPPGPETLSSSYADRAGGHLPDARVRAHTSGYRQSAAVLKRRTWAT
eukprot:5681533-Prymnesium_polylepis.1